MDEATARGYLDRGVTEVERKRRGWDRRQAYFEGRQDLPYAPEGVNTEYLSLREQAVANWLELALTTPVQRLRADGFRTGRDSDADQATWHEVWQANRLDARQRIPYTDMMVHGRGLMSVWPNPGEPRSPVIRPESGRNVHLEPDPEDPFTTLWAVKTFTIDDRAAAGLVLPSTVVSTRERHVAVVYDAATWARFEKGGRTYTGDWQLVDGGEHPLGEPPFVAFDYNQGAGGQPRPAIDALIPAQDAINTIRFQTLLAMQFSAYRQRVFTGYDPVLRDETGKIVYRTDGNGDPVLDANGQKIPVVASPGRVGVDRALVFPGESTKVFDMPESNLSNYVTVLGEFLSDLFARAQVPPQYLLNRMANLSGDALAGAESTLQSLVSDLQRWCGEALEHVMRLANRARGDTAPDLASEVLWSVAEARSFAQTVDGITKLVTIGFPREAAFEMVPGATPQKVRRWLSQVSAQQAAAAAADPLTLAAEAFRTAPAAPGAA